MRRILYAALAAMIATPAFSVTANYINFTYYQPDARYEACEGYEPCREDGEFGDVHWPDPSISEFRLARLWINETVDRANLTISSSDRASDWADHEWGIIPFGLEYWDISRWADGREYGGWLEFTIEFDMFGEISSWDMWGASDDGGAASFSAFSDPRTWNGHEYYAAMYWEPYGKAVYRDPGYWVSDLAPIPLPATGLLLLAGLGGIGCLRWRSGSA